MKKKIPFLLLMFLSFIVLNCSTDDNYKAETSFKFPFTLEVNKDQVYYAQEMGNLKIIPKLEKANDNVKIDYYFTVTSDNPDVLIYYKTDLIKPKNQYRFKDENNIEFKFKKIGQYSVNFKIENQYGFILEHTEVFNVKDIDFYVTLSSEDIIYPKIAKDLSLDIKAKEGEDKKDISYKVSLELENHPNTTEKLEISYLGKKISLKEEFTYSSGDIKIKFPASGDYDFNVRAVSSQGKEVIKKQIVKVEDVKFSFDVTSTKKVYPMDKNLFKIKMESLVEDILQKYSFKYNVTTGTEPGIVYNNTTLSKNTSVPLNGEDIYMVFPKTGVYNIKMVFENQYGYILEKEFAFDVNYANFDIKITNLPKTTYLETEYSFNVEPAFLKEEASKVDYTFKVKSSANTKVYYDDKLINNESYVEYRSSKLKVVFSKEETAELEFSFKNSQGLEVTKKQNFDVRIADFDLELVKEDKYLPNKRTALNFKISDKSGIKDLAYTFNVVTNSPSAKFYYNNNQISKDVNHKYQNGDLSVLFDREGTYEVTVNVKNSHGRTVSKKVVIQIDPVKFNFSISTKDKIYPNEKQQFYLKVTKEDKEDQNFTFSYQVKGASDKPTVNYNNYLLTENQTVVYAGEDLFVTFPKTGVYEIEYTVKNNFGSVQTQKINYDVNFANFDVDVTNIPTTTFLDTKYTMNVVPKLVAGNTGVQKYTMKIEANPSVKAYYKGYQISLNNYIEYTESKIDLEFTSAGQQEVVYMLKNSQGLEVSKKVVFTPKTATFDLDFTKDKQYLAYTKGKLGIKPVDKSGLSNIGYKFNVTYPQDLKVSYNGSAIASGMQLNYTAANLDIETTKSGEYELGFSFENSQGHKVSQKVIIQVDAVKFNYSTELTGNIYPDVNKTFKIIPVKETAIEQTFKVKYIAKGNKPVVTYKGNTLYENDYVDFTSQNIDVLFKEVGTHDLEFSIQNQYGYTQTKTVRFEVGRTKFDIETTGLPKEVFLNQDIEIGITPKSEENLKLKYDLKVSGFDLAATYNGYLMPNNTYTSFSSNKLGLRFSKLGTQEITLTMRNSQGLEVTKKEVILVKSATFDLDVTKDKQYLSYTKGKLGVKPTDNSGLSNITYKFSVTYPQELKVSYNGSAIASGMQLNFTSSNLDIETTQPGDYELVLNFENSNGHKVSQKVLFKVDAVKFNYAMEIEGKIYPDIRKSFKLVPTGEGTIDQNYKIKFTSKGSRPTITYNGNTLYENEYVPFNNQTIQILFKEVGTHDVEFSLQNQFGFTVPKTYKFTVGQTKFDIETKNLPRDVYVNKEFEIAVSPKSEENIANLTYEIKVMGSDVQASYNGYSIPNNNYARYNSEKLGLKFFKVGKQEVTVSMRNSQGLEVNEKLIFDVKSADSNVDFSYPDKIYPIKEIPLKAVLKGANIEGIKHKFRVKSNDSSVVLKYNNSQLAWNTNYDYTSENFVLVFPKAGKYTLTWDFENNLGGSVSKPLVLDVTDTTFEVRVVQPTSIFPKVPGDFRISVNETLPSKYSFKYSVQGGYGGLTEVTQGGKRIYSDEWVAYTAADFKMTFPSEGNYVFTIDFKNEFGKEVKHRFDVKVEQPSFTIEAVNDNQSILKNEDFPLRFVMKKTPTNQTITFTVKGDNNINYIKYSGRKVYPGEELTLTDTSIVFNMKEGTHNIGFDFKNEYNYKISKNANVTVNTKDYKTTISSKILSAPISGYDKIWYENPVKVSIDINSLLQAKDLKIRFRNSSLIDADGTFYPTTFYQLTKLNNTYTFNFDKSINGNANNVLVVDVQDMEGKVTSHNITLPLNIKADKPYIEDITGKTTFYSSSGGTGITATFLDVYLTEARPILVTTPVGIKSASIETYIKRNQARTLWNDDVTSIVKKDNNTFEIHYTKKNVEVFYFKGSSTFFGRGDDVFVITYKVVDNLGQVSVKTIETTLLQILKK